MSNNQFNLNMSLEERERKLLEMSDEEIDFFDIPELDEEFFRNAKLVNKKPKTEAISIRIDSDSLEWSCNHAMHLQMLLLIKIIDNEKISK